MLKRSKLPSSNELLSIFHLSETLKSSTRKVHDYLQDKGLNLEVKQIPETTRTAAEAAKAVNCDIACIAKSLVFRNRKNQTPVMIVASGKNRVDLKKAGQVLGTELEQADADFAHKHTGYAIGGIPPIAHPKPITTLLDIDLKNQSCIWAAAGTPNSLFCLSSDQLELLTGASWVDLAEE